jgi:Trk-type K+ transport system membrane component
VILVGTVLMMLPATRTKPGYTPFVPALFTATSALTTTGLDVEGPDYWSTTGQIIITVLTQVGGYGVMTVATLLTLTVSKQLGLYNRLLVQVETGGLGVNNVRRVLLKVAQIFLVCEAVVAVIMTARLWLRYHYPLGRATWYGLYHSVQAFNNGGFTLDPDNLTEFVSDAWIFLPLTLSSIIGATGFPVLLELLERWRQPAHWSILTRLTVGGLLVLMTVGFLALLLLESSNPKTLGPLSVPAKVLAAFVNGTVPSTGAFSSIPFVGMRDETNLILLGMMFVGGGSASTTGGIKVTTFFLLAFVIWAEIRGEPDVVIGPRRIATVTQRQAITVALLGVGVVALGTLMVLVTTNGVRLLVAAFEATSAFSTIGLTLDTTRSVPTDTQIVLTIVMFVGRVGMIIAGSALALKAGQRQYRYPEEQPLVG